MKSKFITLFEKMKAFLSKMTTIEFFGLELEASWKEAIFQRAKPGWPEISRTKDEPRNHL
jgi:hypothetical protein